MSQHTTVTDQQIIAAQGGDELAMWDIISAYEPMLRSVIRSAAPAAQGDDVEDLLQEARIVLLQHVRDYTTGADAASLSSFAYRAVRRAVAEEWVRMSNAFSVDPTKVIRVRHALWEAGGNVEDAWTSVSTDPDTKRRMSREAFVSACEALAQPDSLEAPLTDDNHGATLGDTIPDASSDFTDAAERRDLAHYLLRTIPQRQSYALRAFHGIGMTKRPDEDVSDDLHISRRKQCEALRGLRQQGVKSARNVATAYRYRVAA
jgi:RNA polymerase primary sigma factor